MRIHKRSIVVVLTAASLLVSMSVANALAAPAPAPQSVGNMKRIVIPEKGEPQTVIAPSANSGSTNGSGPATGMANPAAGGVNVPAMIQGGLKKGGPLLGR
jgi:hypothetical protein